MSTFTKDKSAYKVLAIEKETDKMVAEYIFESLKEAMKFHAQMTAKGYLSIMERIYV
jgi:hypothetical protein